MMGFGETYSAF